MASKRLVQAPDDDIDCMDGLFDSAGTGHVDAGDTGLRGRLAMKAREAEMRRERRQAGYESRDDGQSNLKDDELCCVCEGCGHIFYRQEDVEYFYCPHCQAKHRFEPAEEVQAVAGGHMGDGKLTSLILKEQATERRKQTAARLHMQDTHQNDAKTQASLQMGSAEYREYVADIEASDPARPDDAFHAELEERNGGGDEIVQEPPRETLMERRARLEAEKRGIHAAVLPVLKAKAAQTETEEDDALIASLIEDNPILQDMSIQGNEYAGELAEYVGL